MTKSSDWQSAAASRRAQLDKQLRHTGYTVPEVDDSVSDVSKLDLTNHLDQKQLAITCLAPEVLLEKLADGSFTAYEVTEAFCRRAVIAHSLINCLCQVFFERALARARQLDEAFQRGGPTGPLHGLPISLKNQLSVHGVEMDMCYVGRTGEYAEKSCTLVKILESQGAVMYVLTNMSQGLLSSDSVNNLYGRTVSPFNRELCVGGSSGGEGGLIALRGSPLGVGSDLGGSIRMPAAFNGLYGFRPSSNRVPYQGAENSQQGQELNPSCLGPISPSAAGLRIFFKAVLDARPWTLDPVALHLPWREDEYQVDISHGLCFGFLSSLGRVLPNPPYIRAMKRVRQALESSGYHTIDVQLADDDEGYDIYLETLTADAGQDVGSECARSGEPMLSGTAAGRRVKAKSAYDWWQLAKGRRAYISKQLQLWQRTSTDSPTGRPVDAIIAPVSPYPSFGHGEQDYVFYTAFSNLCDYPTTTFPVGSVQPLLDPAVPARDYLNAWDSMVNQRYCAETFKGMPIGLQLMGPKGEDERVLRLTELVADSLRIDTGSNGTNGVNN